MMSGTSLDGIDACLVEIDDDFNFRFLGGHSMEYPVEVREKLLKYASAIELKLKGQNGN